MHARVTIIVVLMGIAALTLRPHVVSMIHHTRSQILLSPTMRMTINDREKKFEGPSPGKNKFEGLLTSRGTLSRLSWLFIDQPYPIKLNI